MVNVFLKKWLMLVIQIYANFYYKSKKYCKYLQYFSRNLIFILQTEYYVKRRTPTNNFRQTKY